MSIKIEDIGNLDFSDIADTSIKKLPMAHPGEFLLEILQEIGISQVKFAKIIGISAMEISSIVNGTHPVTADLVLLFGYVFNQSPQYLLNLQSEFNLYYARLRISNKIIKIQPFVMHKNPQGLPLMISAE